MNRILSLISAVFALLVSISAHADGKAFPTRSELLFHAGHKLGAGYQLRGHFIPSADLSQKLPPLAYLGLGIPAASWLDVEPVAGWNFGNDEPIASVFIAPSAGKFWNWSDLEIALPSQSAYYFSQSEFRIHDALSLGAEAEGWGCLKGEDLAWSHGVGPNAIFHFRDRATLDLALHVRNQDGETKPQGFIRFQLYFLE